jgi:hypothetical protein
LRRWHLARRRIDLRRPRHKARLRYGSCTADAGLRARRRRQHRGANARVIVRRPRACRIRGSLLRLDFTQTRQPFAGGGAIARGPAQEWNYAPYLRRFI